MGQVANRTSLAFSKCGQLSQAIPQFHGGGTIGPTNSQSIAVKEFWFSRVEFEVLMCGGICVKFLAANSPGNNENFANISPHFSSVSLESTAKMFTRISLWGTMGTRNDNRCYVNERQSRNPNRNTMTAGSMRTNFCVLEGDITASEC